MPNPRCRQSLHASDGSDRRPGSNRSWRTGHQPKLFAGLGSIKAAFDIAKGLKDINDVTIRNGAIIELQEKILTARAAQSALLERISELETEVASFKTWESEKQRYELKGVGAGSFAYAVKESMRGTEPAHHICAACYEHGHKSILQPKAVYPDKTLYCPECKAQIFTGINFSAVP
jgi:hypothetical protein